MSEKLDLFELTVKRGLENLEMPLDNTAWSKFENALDASKMPPAPSSSAGFLPKFGIAAAVLIGAVIFINQSVHDKANTAQIVKAEQIDTQIPTSESAGDIVIDRQTQEIDFEDANAGDVMSSNSTEETEVVLSLAEKERMERINAK
ncbi:MAG: hypothetical protein HKO93_01180, partial [Flavobacteriales bacterium]|nr:hypothetical protein [Flavobacteriales bacterium]